MTSAEGSGEKPLYLGIVSTLCSGGRGRGQTRGHSPRVVRSGDLVARDGAVGGGTYREKRDGLEGGRGDHDGEWRWRR